MRPAIAITGALLAIGVGALASAHSEQRDDRIRTERRVVHKAVMPQTGISLARRSRMESGMQFKVQELTVNLIGGRVSLSLQGEGLTFINVSLPLPAPANSHGGQLEQRVYEEARHLLAAALDALNEDGGHPSMHLEAQLAEGIADVEGAGSDADDEGQFWEDQDSPDFRREE